MMNPTELRRDTLSIDAYEMFWFDLENDLVEREDVWDLDDDTPDAYSRFWQENEPV